MTRISISPKVKAKLEQLRKQSGIGSRRLLRGQSDVPEGLNSSIIQAWLSGSIVSASEEHLNYVLKLWSDREPRITITQAMRDDLNAKIEKSGIGPKNLSMMLRDRYHNISPNMVSDLKRGKRKSAPKAEWEAILGVLSSVIERV